MDKGTSTNVTYFLFFKSLSFSGDDTCHDTYEDTYEDTYQDTYEDTCHDVTLR